MDEKKHILFVDDEAQVLNGLRRMLRNIRDEWTMSFAESGEAALEIMSSGHIDVLVTDMRMPGMNGAQLLEIVRERHPGTIRLILSGHSDQGLILRSVNVAHQFMAKPCDPEMLIGTVKRCLKLRSYLGDERLATAVSQIRDLPALPEAYDEITRILQTEEPSIARISSVIERDVGISAKVVHMANSAFFGLKRHVESPADAVLYLGIDTVKAVVLGSGVFSSPSAPLICGLSIATLEKHCFRVGMISRWVAGELGLGRDGTDEAFTGGILHDVGKLIFAVSFADQYSEVMSKISRGEECSSSVELAVMGGTHGAVGGYLLGLWGVADPIVESVVFHADPRQSPGQGLCPLTAVHIADWLDYQLQSAHEAEASTGPDRAYLETLGISDRWGTLLEGAQALMPEGEAQPVGGNDGIE